MVVRTEELTKQMTRTNIYKNLLVIGILLIILLTTIALLYFDIKNNAYAETNESNMSSSTFDKGGDSSTYDKGETDQVDLLSMHELKMGWIRTILSLLVTICLAALAYVFAFFVFNYYIVVDNKIVRACKIGKKYTKVRLLTFDFRMIYRSQSQVFKNRMLAGALVEVEDEMNK